VGPSTQPSNEVKTSAMSSGGPPCQAYICRPFRLFIISTLPSMLKKAGLAMGVSDASFFVAFSPSSGHAQRLRAPFTRTHGKNCSSHKTYCITAIHADFDAQLLQCADQASTTGHAWCTWPQVADMQQHCICEHKPQFRAAWVEHRVEPSPEYKGETVETARADGNHLL